jgi:Ca2+-binding EF-hand superfamily protein
MKLQAVLDDGTMLRRPTRGTSLVKGRGSSFKRGVSVQLRNTSLACVDDDGGALWDGPQIAVAHSMPPKRTAPPTTTELFELIDLNGDGNLSKNEVVSAAGLLDMTPEEAARFFDSLDVNGSGIFCEEQLGAGMFVVNAAAGLDSMAGNLATLLERYNPSADAFSKSEAAASLFEVIDLNGDGELSRSEVIAAAGLLGLTEEQAARLFDAMDEDESGTLTHAEFGARKFAGNVATGLRNFAADASSKSEALASLFEVINPDGDGELTKSEVIDAAGLLGLTEEEAARLFNDMDEDGSGTLTRAEFGATAFAGDLATGLASMSSLLDISVFSFSGGTRIVRPEQIPSDDSKRALYFASRDDDTLDLNRIPKITIPKHVRNSQRSLSPVFKGIGSSI